MHDAGVRDRTQTQPANAEPDEGDPALIERIRREISASPDEHITFARFMEMALTEPGLGYYATSDARPTRDGDFLTAPELHPFFGRCIGRLLSDVWTRLGSPDRFVVQEWGAGRGTLRRTTLDGLAADDSSLARAIDWQAVDLPGRHPDLDEAPFVGVVIANEYLDALPVHRLVSRRDRILERYVTWLDGRFTEVDGELSDATLVAPLDAARLRLADGQLAEVRPAAEAWLRLVATRLTHGMVLVIDYGHQAQELYGPLRMAGSLVTYRDHVAGDDPFAAVGRQDLTAHVDISALERVAEALGLDRLGSTTQAWMLVGLGLGELLYQLGHDQATDPADYLDARASVGRLLDPRHLGGFRVLGFGRGISAGSPIVALQARPGP